jgi:hypothetical protein
VLPTKKKRTNILVSQDVSKETKETLGLAFQQQ